jgi:ATP-dependent metalloprotease FtsH
MDDKANRRLQADQSNNTRTYGPKNLKPDFSKFVKLLNTNKQSLLASALLLIIIALLFGVVTQLQPPSVSGAPQGITVLDYSTFEAQLRAGNVLAVTIQGNDLTGLLINPIGQNHSSAAQTSTPGQRAAELAAWTHFTGGSNTWSVMPTSPAIDPSRTFYTRLPANGDATLTSLLLSKGVNVTTISSSQSSFLLGLLWRFIPLILFALLFFALLAPRKGTPSIRTMDDRITQLGKTRARRFDRIKERNASTPQAEANKSTITNTSASPVSSPAIGSPPPVTFADVAGIDEVRTELEEIVQFLRSSDRYHRLGAHIPRGALLVGPPGTGKTLLAKAVAGEAAVPFFSMSASEFVEIYVGVGASRVRNLFAQARQAAPCVIFIDELDAVGRKRSTRINSSDERDQTLNQLLVELDGFDARQAVVVLAATNRVDILDKALLRPGRFDRQITVSMPDRAGREAILAVHTRKTPLHEDVSLARLSRMTTGMSGADLANLVNEAALCAARQNLDCLTHNCFEEALARVQLGALRPIVMNETERRIIAFHEGGHALVAHHLPLADKVNRVTILPRGQSLGVTQFIAEEDRYNYSRETLMSRIAVGLGGRVAEELTFGPERVTTGAENDLQVVTDLARRMVTRWGMSEQVGVVFADNRSELGGSSFNMQRQDDIQPSSLVADVNGNLLLNGKDVPATHQAFAMASPALSSASSPSMAALIDTEVQRILNEGHTIAHTILSEHYDQLTLLANTLMEREQLDRAQFEQLLEQMN